MESTEKQKHNGRI